ncbi:MFS transporter [Streptomyces sp. NPDC059389]|uniref:MFS transporter n=1 Tax=Streptomyces sp. NPDC059389 TaxID=3346818 RepID=UPI00368892EE
MTVDAAPDVPGGLALPGVRTALLLIFPARLPLTAVSVSLTLHVMEERGLGYGAAGVLVAAWLLGAALGAALVGRAMDRFGVRRVVAVCGLCSAAFMVLPFVRKCRSGAWRLRTTPGTLLQPLVIRSDGPG